MYTIYSCMIVINSGGGGDDDDDDDISMVWDSQIRRILVEVKR